MKKLYTLALVALLGTTYMNAQSVVINKTDGTTLTINSDQIKNIEFVPNTQVNNTVAGVYNGSTTLTVMATDFKADNAAYTITTNADGTINVTSISELYSGTPMGDITVGTLTINNIPYDAATMSYKRDYTADALQVELIYRGKPKNYDITKGEITLKFDGNGGLNIAHNYSLKGMPMPLSAVFNGAK